jgi:hypothetical protein
MLALIGPNRTEHTCLRHASRRSDIHDGDRIIRLGGEKAPTRPGLPSGQARNTDCEGELWLTRSGRIGGSSRAGISRIAGEDRRGHKAFDDQPDAQRKLK